MYIYECDCIVHQNVKKKKDDIRTKVFGVSYFRIWQQNHPLDFTENQHRPFQAEPIDKQGSCPLNVQTDQIHNADLQGRRSFGTNNQYCA